MRLLLLLGLVAGPLLAAGPKPPHYCETVVRARDGTNLSTVVVFPQDPATLPRGGRPVVLQRTPYGKLTRKWEMFTREGWIAVAQDMRGFFGSGGERLPFVHDGWGETQDGVDTLAWIAAQPWCNGQIGTYGASANAITQILLAGAGPAQLTAMVPIAYPASMYGEGAYQGGVFRDSLSRGWIEENAPAILPVYLAHHRYDDFWRTMDFRPRAAHANAPGLHISGWFDLYLQGTLDAFEAIQRGGGPRAAGRQRLIVGPWAHFTIGKPGPAPSTFPANAALDVEAEAVAFLRARFAGEPDPRPAVRYYTMGALGEPGAPGNVWHDAPDWPLPSTPSEYFLTAAGTLARDAAPEKPSARSFPSDPTKPVPTVGGIMPSPEHGIGPADQRSVLGRPDVLEFDGAPLAAPLEITGRVTARLFVSSDVRDADFTVKLIDLYPDGRALLVADGIQRARFRHGSDREVWLERGKVEELTVDLWSTSYIFNRGHRIKIAVSSSNYPRFEANPNTGTPHPEAGHPGIVAINTLHFGRNCPSAIVLPLRKL